MRVAQARCLEPGLGAHAQRAASSGSTGAELPGKWERRGDRAPLLAVASVPASTWLSAGRGGEPLPPPRPAGPRAAVLFPGLGFPAGGLGSCQSLPGLGDQLQPRSQPEPHQLVP